MADFGTMIRVAILFGLAALLSAVLDEVLAPVTATSCGANAPTGVVDGTANCGYLGDAQVWVLLIVAVSMFVLVVNRAIVNGRT